MTMNYEDNKEKFYFIYLQDLLYELQEFMERNYGTQFDLTEVMEYIIENSVARSGEYIELRMNIRSVSYMLVGKGQLSEEAYRELDSLFLRVVDEFKSLFVLEYPHMDNYAEKGWFTNTVILAPHGTIYHDATDTERNCVLLSLSVYKMLY